LPLPETPVTAIKVPRGIFAVTFCKLFPVAPLKVKYLPSFAFLLICGIEINFFPDKYCPVILF